MTDQVKALPSPNLIALLEPRKQHINITLRIENHYYQDMCLPVLRSNIISAYVVYICKMPN